MARVSRPTWQTTAPTSSGSPRAGPEPNTFRPRMAPTGSGHSTSPPGLTEPSSRRRHGRPAAAWSPGVVVATTRTGPVARRCRRRPTALKGRRTIRAPGCRRCAHRPDSSTRRSAPPLDRRPSTRWRGAPNGATAQTVAPPGQPTKEHRMSITFCHRGADRRRGRRPWPSRTRRASTSTTAAATACCAPSASNPTTTAPSTPPSSSTGSTTALGSRWGSGATRTTSPSGCPSCATSPPPPHRLGRPVVWA